MEEQDDCYVSEINWRSDLGFHEWVLYHGKTNLGFYEMGETTIVYLGKTISLIWFYLINMENDYYNATNNFIYQRRWLFQLEKRLELGFHE